MTTFEKETLKTLLLIFEMEVSRDTLDMLNPREDLIDNLKREASDIRLALHFMKRGER